MTDMRNRAPRRASGRPRHQTYRRYGTTVAGGLVTAAVLTLMVLYLRPSERNEEDGVRVHLSPSRSRCIVTPASIQEGLRHVASDVSPDMQVQILAESGHLLYGSSPGRASSSGGARPRQRMARFEPGRYTVECHVGTTKMETLLTVVPDR